MIFYSYYLAKTALVSFLLISSITFEATCSGSVSKLFNSIVGIPSANEGEHSAASNSNQRPLKLKLADAQMLQQWIGQIARKIVVEDGIFAGIYSCGPKINIDAVILTDGLPDERIKKIDKNLLKEVQNPKEKSQFLKLLFSFGAMLSAEIGEQSQQNGTLRALLKAYECVGGKFAKENDGISDIVIGAFIKISIEQSKIEKIILESHSISNNRRLIYEFSLLNALNIEMTPNDVINFAFFIKSKFLSHSLKKYILELSELSLSNFGEDPVKYQRIAHQLVLHLNNWELEELKKLSLKKSSAINLTQREKCIFSTFARNLLRRIAKFELLDDYFGELNIPGQVENNKFYLKFYEEFSADNCKKVKENEGLKISKIYPFIDEAIRIDWNVWKEIIQQIDEITMTVVKSKDNKQNLVEYLKSDNFEDAMKIIKAKFDETKFGQKLKADVKKMLKLNDEKMPEDEIVNQFCSNLAKIRQICEENIEQYEREVSLKKNFIIKQKENHNKFYDLLAIVVKHFGGNSFKNDNEESIEFDLNGAKSFLKKVYISAKELLQNKNLNFETAIRAILDKNLNEKAKNLLKEFYVSPKNAEKGDLKNLEVNVKAQLFELFFSFAARLEAIVHGKNIDGTIEKSRENPKDKIRAFLAVPNCFNVPEWANKFSIFDYWMEIKDLNSKESQKMPGIGVAIFRKIDENEETNKEAKSISGENYKTLKRLNEHKFSIYEWTKHLKRIYFEIGIKHDPSTELEIPKMINPILSEIHFKWYKKGNYSNDYRKYIKGCELTKLYQNFLANFMKMLTENRIDAQLHMDTWDSEIQAEVERDFGKKYCKEIEGIDRKVDLNNVRYDLVLNFKFNARKDVHDRTEDLLKKWAENKNYEERAFADGNENYIITRGMTDAYNSISKEMRERIYKIETLKAKENDQIDLMGLFDRSSNLVQKIVKEMPNLKMAKEELKQLEKSESDANDEKKMLYDEIEKLKRQIPDIEKKAINLENEILLQKEENKMPKKQRENAPTFLAWLISKGAEKMTKETKQILQKICTLSELNQKVERLEAKMEEYQRSLTIELGHKLYDASRSQKIIENNKKSKMVDKVTEAADKLKIAQLKRLKELQQKLHTSQQTLNGLTTKMFLFPQYYGAALWQIVDKFCEDLNKTKMSEEKIEKPDDHKKRVEELGEQIDEASSQGVAGELDALFMECQIEREEKKKERELKEKLKKIEELKKMKEKYLSIKEKEMAENDKKLAEILKEKVQKQKEVNTLDKELKENRELAQKIGKNLRQMLEEIMKN